MNDVSDEVGDDKRSDGFQAIAIDEFLDSPAYHQSATDREAELVAALRKTQVEIETRQRDLNRLIGESHRQGVSWSKIGEALGISAQAAQQRSKRLTAVSRSNTGKGI